MLAKNPELLKAKNNQGITPLMTAIQHGHLHVVQLLHANDADFNECLPNGLFPLYMSMLKNFTSIAMWMLDNVANLNVNLQLDNKMTALHLSIQGEDNILSLKLLDKGAQCNITRKADGHTACIVQRNLAIWIYLIVCWLMRL